MKPSSRAAACSSSEWFSSISLSDHFGTKVERRRSVQQETSMNRRSRGEWCLYESGCRMCSGCPEVPVGAHSLHRLLLFAQHAAQESKLSHHMEALGKGLWFPLKVYRAGPPYKIINNDLLSTTLRLCVDCVFAQTPMSVVAESIPWSSSSVPVTAELSPSTTNSLASNAH